MMSVALAERIAADLSGALQHAETSIAQMVVDGDVEQLKEARSQADAHRLYEDRAGATERAQIFARIKLLAEAGLGALSFDAYPALTSTAYPEGICIGDEVIAVTTAKRWRLLAIAQERGVLGRIVDDLIAADLGLGTVSVAYACGRRGVSGVPGETMKKLIKRQALNRGISVDGLAALTGLNSKTLYSPSNVVMWRHAKTIAEALGANPVGLPLAARTRNVPRYRRRWLERKLKPTGGRWDKAYAQFRKALDEFAAIAGEGTQWDGAYDHFYALEETLGRAMKKEAYGG